MKDKLSALLDDGLEEHSANAVFDRLRNDKSLRADWDVYCLIGDTLRGEGACAPEFVDQVMAKLDAAPVVLAPAASARRETRSVWHALMPVAASVMGVAAVGMVAQALYSRTEQAVVVANVPVVQRVETVQRPVPVVAEDPNREYVFAHQTMAGGPLPGAMQYVRTVSDLRQDSAR